MEGITPVHAGYTWDARLTTKRAGLAITTIMVLCSVRLLQHFEVIYIPFQNVKNPISRNSMTGSCRHYGRTAVSIPPDDSDPDGNTKGSYFNEENKTLSQAMSCCTRAAKQNSFRERTIVHGVFLLKKGSPKNMNYLQSTVYSI